ncbi:o-succinylbenzoate synthase [Geofilum rubicundum]|uniref:o-succinylbenzoate synthase n=1 Tax=Geofilum rubicundum JCM 15548 TaxID=1236989 RepID=A0A0E9LYW1_9BACT|nr:o-succinylbenzoate synthase [Geofilum rubicundum]GAO30777.1 O-succinylbenzoate synthase [Geofilum rubicundum JCM 15548]
MYKATLHPHQLIFHHPGGTSRGVLSTKMSYYLHISKEAAPEVTGRGECSILPGLSPDDRPDLEEKLQWCCQNIDALIPDFHKHLKDWPAIRFAVEMALADLHHGGRGIYYPSDFTMGQKEIPINGLIWMGNTDEMKRRIEEKLEEGFNCLKLKIGALDFDSEIQLIKSLRKRFNPQTLELRVDANGAFSPRKAPGVLDQLARLSIHSIEQPLKAGQWKEMAQLCATTPIPIALDEELIGLQDENTRKEMITSIRPQYIILKPSLTGGFSSSEKWIKQAESVDAGWWITSALEANIGLNAIAQWTATLNNPMPQGLGTGQVFTNNLDSPLVVEHGKLRHRTPSA